LAFVFAWVLGFGSTIAEPALNAMGTTVETLTNGAMTKRTLISAVLPERSTSGLPSTHHKLSSLALHYLPFSSRLPLPHF
jgi:hypothetical protein